MTPEEQRDLARLNRMIGYAVKFTIDAPGLEPADVAIATILAGCARPPRPAEYPQIRILVKLWRDGQASVAAAVREALLARAETYTDDWHRFAGMLRPGAPGRDTLTEGSARNIRRSASLSRIAGEELRKIADGIPQ
jgi:hypothetical protein